MDLPAQTFWDQWGEGITIVLAAAVAAFVVAQALRAWRAYLATRAAMAAEEGYRKLAEQMAATISEGAEHRRADSAVLAEMQRRLGAIETLLRQVE